MWLTPKLRNLMRNRIKSREIRFNDIVHEENFNPIWYGKLESFTILEYEYFTIYPRQDDCEMGFCLTFVLWSPQLCQRLFPRMRLFEYIHIEGNNFYVIKCQWKQSVADMLIRLRYEWFYNISSSRCDTHNIIYKGWIDLTIYYKRYFKWHEG